MSVFYAPGNKPLTFLIHDFFVQPSNFYVHIKALNSETQLLLAAVCLSPVL